MATATVDRWFIDANILVYANLLHHPLHGQATARLLALAAARSEVWISRQVMREYLSAMTRPGAYTGSIPITSLIADVQRFERSHSVAEDRAAVTANLLSLLTTIPIGGKQVHDANIVATMLTNAIPNLLTHNTADFQRFAGLITVVPLVP
jgi:predicted nucleic acid-binding protein